MNAANLELCKELYEVSGWYGDFYFTQYEVKPFEATTLVGRNGVIATAYSLGYLLRKLPYPRDIRFSETHDLTIIDFQCYPSKVVSNIYAHEFRVKADTPEDAAVKLAIELFKQGVLKL